MSAAKRQRSCAACGGPLREGERTDLEPLIDGVVRYVAVHAGHSTHAPLRERWVAGRLARVRILPAAGDGHDGRYPGGSSDGRRDAAA
jgi:hypothetical protein